jgi:hypothetical protein
MASPVERKDAASRNAPAVSFDLFMARSLSVGGDSI